MLVYIYGVAKKIAMCVCVCVSILTLRIRYYRPPKQNT